MRLLGEATKSQVPSGVCPQAANASSGAASTAGPHCCPKTRLP